MRPSSPHWLIFVISWLPGAGPPGVPASVSVSWLRAATAPVLSAQAAPVGGEAHTGQTKAVQAPPLQAPAPTPAPGNPVATISTSLGDITIELFADRAPVSVENFLQYAREGFYADTIFHRVKPGFMIQGGGFTPSFSEKPTRP